VSFPKPVFGTRGFAGPSTNWNVFNLASSVAPPPALNRAFNRYTGVQQASGLLFDSAANKVYNPKPYDPQRGENGQKDYDFSSASPNASSTDMLGRMGADLGQLEMLSLGVHGGVYYGLQIGARFRNPYGVAVDGRGNVFVADFDNRLVRRIDGITGAVTNLGTTAIPPFGNPRLALVLSLPLCCRQSPTGLSPPLCCRQSPTGLSPPLCCRQSSAGLSLHLCCLVLANSL
jgi:hypothetical protein